MSSLPSGTRINVNHQAPPPPKPTTSTTPDASATGADLKESTNQTTTIDYRSNSSSVFKDFLKRIAWNAQQQPLLLLGLVFTCTAFGVGVHAFKKGNGHRSNLMMRFRVGGQMFTVGAAAWYNWFNTPPRYDEYVLAKRRAEAESKP